MKSYVSDNEILFGCSDGSKCLVALQSHNKRFVSAEENGKVHANSEKLQNSEVFEVIFQGPKYVLFKNYHKNYLGAESNGNLNYKYGRVHWTVEYKGKDGFAFKSIWGKYLVADTNGALDANQKNAGLFGFFKVIKIKGRYKKNHL